MEGLYVKDLRFFHNFKVIHYYVKLKMLTTVCIVSRNTSSATVRAKNRVKRTPRYIVMTRKIEKNGKHKFDTTARNRKESPTSSSRNFLSAHEKVMKFLERQRERERDSGGV